MTALIASISCFWIEMVATVFCSRIGGAQTGCEAAYVSAYRLNMFEKHREKWKVGTSPLKTGADISVLEMKDNNIVFVMDLASSPALGKKGRLQRAKLSNWLLLWAPSTAEILKPWLRTMKFSAEKFWLENRFCAGVATVQFKKELKQCAYSFRCVMFKRYAATAKVLKNITEQGAPGHVNCFAL